MNNRSLSDRAQRIPPSPTLSITAKANRMKSEGVDVVSFAAGEPDFNTPESICDAAIDAIRSGFTKYTPSSGTPELKQAIAGKLERENGLKVEAGNVVVSCGAKHSLYNTMQVLLNPGDEVILFAPYWMTYAEQIKLAGATPVVVHTTLENGFAPTLEQLRSAVNSKTRAIVVNSPSNPAGAVLPRETVKEIAAVALKHSLWVISDEIYERLVYGTKATTIATLGSEIARQTITIGGVAKTYAMTGWRIGFAVAPPEVVQAMSNFQDQVTSNPTSFAQKGAAAAFNLPAEAVESMRSEFEARRDLIVGLLRQIPGVRVSEPKGAFYVFPDMSAFLHGDICTDYELSNYLLEAALVATVPGSVFEGEGHLRLSYAASRIDIERGVARIAQALGKRAA